MNTVIKERATPVQLVYSPLGGGAGEAVNVTHQNSYMYTVFENLVRSDNSGTVKLYYVPELGSEVFCFRRKFGFPPNNHKL